MSNLNGPPWDETTRDERISQIEKNPCANSASAEARKWLNENFPQHDDPFAYWNE